jgi:hypothetical protein
MVWKVKEWFEPYPKSVDRDNLRQELCRTAAPWAACGKDGKYVENLLQGYRVQVLSLNRELGVRVEKFPKLWTCKRCDRIYQGNEPTKCKCESTRFGQLPFVGYHGECGAIRPPYIASCPTHKEVKMVRPGGTARAEEIRFVCPICDRTLQRGFGFPPCSCGRGNTVFNVHRAASVYTPRTLVMINPPSTEKVAQIREAGGSDRALAWILSGLKAATLSETGTTVASFRASLRKQGISDALADLMVEKALESGDITDDADPIDLKDQQLVEAQQAAVNIALALIDSRVRIEDLAEATQPDSELGRKYRVSYPRAVEKLGLQGVEFIHSFPVLTGCYGYTRGDSDPGASRLVPFKNKKGDYVVYGDVAKTEALFVRLRPELVAEWLCGRGYCLDPWRDQKSARLSILRAISIPLAGSRTEPPTAGSTLLTLIHSYSHWFIRQIAVHAGIERTSLSEFLVPQHCGFFIYAASRGDFVLGGLQAVYETQLDSFLLELANSDFRCPLDPGCRRVSAACVACLHLGEPSCRYYNSYLSRQTLTGSQVAPTCDAKPA